MSFRKNVPRDKFTLIMKLRVCESYFAPTLISINFNDAFTLLMCYSKGTHDLFGKC